MLRLNRRAIAPSGGNTFSLSCLFGVCESADAKLDPPVLAGPSIVSVRPPRPNFSECQSLVWTSLSGDAIDAGLNNDWNGTKRKQKWTRSRVSRDDAPVGVDGRAT